jgi:HTH-type transcriptional regulator/antitoxin HigA
VFKVEDWDAETVKELRGLSRFDVGPRLAQRFLEDRGIVLDIVPHLSHTRLDGAAMIREDGTPIIAMTVRHDRVDNFWFTLFHELVHVLRHLRTTSDGTTQDAFLDDLDVEAGQSKVEGEADALAREMLVPEEAWKASACRFVAVPVAVKDLAREVGVADAVVAGRVRWEKRNFRLLSSMLGSGTVRSLFPEISWSS